MRKNTKNAKKKKNRKGRQIEFYKVIAAPVLVYGRVNWDLNRSKGRKIGTE
jgi:hypothetical protein